MLDKLRFVARLALLKLDPVPRNDEAREALEFRGDLLVLDEGALLLSQSVKLGRDLLCQKLCTRFATRQRSEGF